VKLSELFNEDNIVLGIEPGPKPDLLERMLKLLDDKRLIKDFPHVLRDVIEREKVMSTGIGSGVAIPHAYTDGVDRLVTAFFRARSGVDFDALDNEDVDLFFLILGPKASRKDHIRILARISRLLNHGAFRAELREAADVSQVLDVFKRFGDR